MTRFDDVSDLWRAWMFSASWQLCVFIGIVAVVSWLCRPCSARLRYGLWLLVLVKVFLPPTLTSPWSLGTPVASMVPDGRSFELTSTASVGSPSLAETTSVPAAYEVESVGSNDRVTSWPASLALAWAAGCSCLWLVVGVRYLRFSRTLAASQPVDEGPLRVMLEITAQSLNIKRVPELFRTEITGSPFLFGVVYPRVVIPQTLIEQLSEAEMRAVLLHELMHWKRADTWVGWFQVIAQGLFWFHPLVWWANNHLRQSRESACDEMVLQHEHCRPQQYGEALVRILTLSRGRSMVGGTLVGVFERGTKLQSRLEEIMNYEPGKRQFSWVSRGAIVLFAALFLPMASVTEPVAADSAANADGASDASPSTAYPRVVRTVPTSGSTGVDAALDAVTITFDRAMKKGMSWTGGPPLFPPADKTKKAYWKDDRTCVLPVKLAQGEYYRLGINSKSFKNFRSNDGTPSPPSVICFATKGAPKTKEQRVREPKVVRLEPENGSRDVDPAIGILRVTFDRPMGESMSWTGGGPTFPEIPDGKKPQWSQDGKTCMLPVELAPAKEYTMGLNSLSHINFQSKWGVPLKPVRYQFTTRGNGGITGQRTRTWTDATGNFTVEATFVEVSNDQVRLMRADGREVTLSLEQLSPADREFAQAADREFAQAADREFAQAAGGESAPSTTGGGPVELMNDDGKPTGKKSFPRGIASAFEAPGDGYQVNSIRIHGGRYGYPRPPKEDFQVAICDKDFNLIADFTFPYSKFKRGDPEWVSLRLKPTEVPKTFVVCLDFSPERTKGVFVSHDADGTSLVGLPGKAAGSFTGGDWMIRPMVDARKP